MEKIPTLTSVRRKNKSKGDLQVMAYSLILKINFNNLDEKIKVKQRFTNNNRFP